MDQFFISKHISKHFNLRNAKSGKPSIVYLVVRIGSKQYKVSLGVKVLPYHFKNDQAMISSYLSKLDNKNNDIVNKKIIEYNEKFSEYISYLCNLDDCNAEIANETFNNIFNMKKKTNKPLASAVLTQCLINKHLSESSFEIYNGILKEFLSWCKEYNVCQYIEDITPSAIKKYISFLQNKKVIHPITNEEVFVEDNTVRNKLTTFFAIFNFVEYDGFDPSKITRLKPKKIDHTEENQVYLSDEEIDDIINIELKGIENAVRDIFLFQLETGQRISDIKKYFCNVDVREKIKDGFVELVQKKTKTKLTIPLSDLALEILEKNNYILPNVSTNTINATLKLICKKCGINEICHCSEKRGGSVYEYNCEKWQLIKTHTARRSFVSNNIIKGVSSELIKSVSGHKSDLAFQRYNRVQQEVLAKQFAQKVLSKARKDKESNNIPHEQEAFNPEPNPAQITPNKIEEYKRVLTMLGVSPIKWIECNNEEELMRMICYEETKIGDYKILKDIFNDDNLSLEDKVKKVEGLINN